MRHSKVVLHFGVLLLIIGLFFKIIARGREF